MTKIDSGKLDIQFHFFESTFMSKVAASAHVVSEVAKNIFNAARHPLFLFCTVGSFASAYTPLNEPYRFLLPCLAGYSFAVVRQELKSGHLHIRWGNKAEKPQIKDIPPAEVVEPSSVVEITEANFKEEVLESKIPVILDAYSLGCSPCRKISPIFNELSNEYRGKVKFAKFDVNLNDSLMRELDITLLPTFLIYKEGENIARRIGVPSFDKNEFDLKLVKSLDLNLKN